MLFTQRNHSKNQPNEIQQRIIWLRAHGCCTPYLFCSFFYSKCKTGQMADAKIIRSVKQVSARVFIFVQPFRTEFIKVTNSMVFHIIVAHDVRNVREFGDKKNSFDKSWYAKEFLIRKIMIKAFCRVKNSCALHRTFNVEPLYLQHENSG